MSLSIVHMKKICFISHMASPHQVRFQPFLQKYFDSYFYFYERLAGRQSWWAVELGDRCKVMNCCLRFNESR